MIDFSMTDEQQLLVNSARDYTNRFCTEEKVREMYAAHIMSDEAAAGYRDAGFGLMNIPEEYGGVPCDRMTLCLMMEALYHGCGSMLPFLNIANTMVKLTSFGTPEQARWAVEEYNKTGFPLASLAISEPEAGSDNANMHCVTHKQADGTYLLNGQKTWVTYGEAMPYLLTIAKEEDPARENPNMSFWILPVNTPGVSTGKLQKLGQGVVPFCDVFFDDVVLTEDMRVGQPGTGFKELMSTFEIERAILAAQVLGIAQAAMDDAAAYSSERLTFGTQISKHQLIMEHLSEMEIDLINARNFLYKVCWMMDHGQSVRIEAALLKRYATRAALDVADRAVAIYGGLGYTTETRVGRMFLDLRGTVIAGGTPEIMVYIAGRQIAKKYKK